MTIILNDKPTEVDSNITVATLAFGHQVEAAGSAVAVNGKLVRRSDWDSVTLKENDNVLIIKAAYGG